MNIKKIFEDANKRLQEMSKEDFLQELLSVGFDPYAKDTDDKTDSIVTAYESDFLKPFLSREITEKITYSSSNNQLNQDVIEEPFSFNLSSNKEQTYGCAA